MPDYINWLKYSPDLQVEGERLGLLNSVSPIGSSSTLISGKSGKTGQYGRLGRNTLRSDFFSPVSDRASGSVVFSSAVFPLYIKGAFLPLS